MENVVAAKWNEREKLDEEGRNFVLVVFLSANQIGSSGLQFPTKPEHALSLFFEIVLVYANGKKLPRHFWGTGCIGDFWFSTKKQVFDAIEASDHMSERLKEILFHILDIKCDYNVWDKSFICPFFRIYERFRNDCGWALLSKTFRIPSDFSEKNRRVCAKVPCGQQAPYVLMAMTLADGLLEYHSKF